VGNRNFCAFQLLVFKLCVYSKKVLKFLSPTESYIILRTGPKHEIFNSIFGRREWKGAIQDVDKYAPHQLKATAVTALHQGLIFDTKQYA